MSTSLETDETAPDGGFDLMPQAPALRRMGVPAGECAARAWRAGFGCSAGRA